jgi:HK97 family phage prohead protease
MLENIADIETQIRESDLEALEAYRKGTADAPMLYRTEGYLKVSEDGQPQVFVASEETSDRMGDLISVEGWDLTNYKRNPVILLGHDHRIPPIARAGKIWTEDKQLLNNVVWDEEDPLGAAIMGKYQRGFMRAESVGFKPIEFRDRDDGKGLLFTKQELLEISLVSVPMHPKALRKAMGDGKFILVMPESIDSIKWSNPDDISAKSGASISKATKQALIDVRSSISLAVESLAVLIGDNGSDDLGDVSDEPGQKAIDDIVPPLIDAEVAKEEREDPSQDDAMATILNAIRNN